ncbi:hypothetical protein OE88DRAFT_416042 [Heliocybe sulcata]|uniref:C2H2-type domain-containing protein n=1 Tax=Heliocybe sulcata TaxID=5364 RepID=A0A5C3N011_9AGAM|nr:hypothetical protein OE88DRAFT_416042 [Heliocybe sulcata]
MPFGYINSVSEAPSTPSSPSLHEVELILEDEQYSSHFPEMMSEPLNNAALQEPAAGGAEIFLCGSCNRQYKSKAALEQHYHDSATHGGVPPVTCNICNREYCSQSALEQHYRDAVGHGADGTATEVIPIHCPTCGRKYTSQKAMEQHWKDTPGHGPAGAIPNDGTGDIILTEISQDTLRCSACTRRFRTRQALKQHCLASQGHSPLVPDGDV